MPVWYQRLSVWLAGQVGFWIGALFIVVAISFGVIGMSLSHWGEDLLDDHPRLRVAEVIVTGLLAFCVGLVIGAVLGMV